MKKIKVIVLVSMFCISFCRADAKGVVTTATLNADDLAVDESSGKIFAVNTGSSFILVADGSTGQTTNSVSIGGRASDTISVNSETGKVYVKRQGTFSFTGSTPGGVVVINGNSETNTGSFIQITGSIADIEVDSENNRVFVSGLLQTTGKVHLIDGSSDTLVDTLNIPGEGGQQIEELAVCGNNKILATDQQTGKVHIIKASNTKLSLVDSLIIDNDGGNISVACNTTTNRAYVAGSNTGDDVVHVINVKKASKVTTIPVDALVFNSGSNFVSDIAVDSTSNKIYVAQNDSSQDSIVVIDGASNKLDESTELGSVVFSQIKVNPSTNKVYVLDGINNQLTIINGSVNPPQSGGGGDSSGDDNDTQDTITQEEKDDAIDTIISVGDSILDIVDSVNSFIIPRKRKINKAIKSLKKLAKKFSKTAKALEKSKSNSKIASASACAGVFNKAVDRVNARLAKIESFECASDDDPFGCLTTEQQEKLLDSTIKYEQNSDKLLEDNDNSGIPDICDTVLKPVEADDNSGPSPI